MYISVKNLENTFIKDKWLRMIGIPAIIILLVLLDDVGPDHFTAKMILFKLTRNTVFVLGYWELNRMIFTYMRNRYPDLVDTSKRILHHMLVFMIFTLFAGLVFTLINLSLPQNTRDDFWSEYLEVLKKSALLLGVVTIIYECVYYFGLYERSQLESERLKKEALVSQIELLKNQISPHFLFNSLNALITMVPEDTRLSVLFIQKLSNVYRHVLSYNGKNLIDLQTEKDFLDDYIFLHQIRFNSNLSIHFQLPKRLDQLQVIPFTLQMLVENAIKHNIISNKKAADDIYRGKSKLNCCEQ